MPHIAAASWKVSEAARRLHQDVLVGTITRASDDPSVDLEILEHWRAAGVDYLSVNVGYDVVDWQHTVKNIGAFLTWLEKHPDRFTLIRNADDILAAKQAGSSPSPSISRYGFAGRRILHGLLLLSPGRAPDALRLQPDQSRRRRPP